MKLSTIIEGFRYETDLPPDELENGNVQLIRDSGNFKFYESDSPQDFIHVEAVMLSKDLQIKPEDPNSLSTFAGAKIWYGFKLVEPTTYQTRAVKTEYPRVEVTSVIKQILDMGHTPNGGGKIKTLDSLKALQNEWAIYAQQANPDMGHDIEEYQNQVDRIQDLIWQMKSNGSTTIPGFLQTLGKTDTATKGKVTKHLKHLQIAFAKAVKDPRSDSELEVAIRFAGMTTDLFASNGPKDYSIIAYPKSSKGFNKEMAETIAESMGAFPIQINKVKVKDVQINKDEMLWRAQAMAKRNNHKLEAIATDRGNFEPTHPNWPQEWRDKEAQKLVVTLPKDPEAEAAIHALQYGDKRRYAQLFGIDDPELFTGEPILIVDDNVAHQGTMEMLHALLNITEPARLDMYTPLLLPT